MKKSGSTFLHYNPKGENQKKYFNLLNDNSCKIIISTGPAGTGKTIFACQKAITQLKSEEISKIVITRPIVTVEEDIGFLPGTLNKKMDPWVRPVFDLFLEYYNKAELDALLNNNKLEICPLMFMRGRTFKNAFIIADEMQNSSPNQMKMLTTRIGENSRMVITGDLQQTDIFKENGLKDIINKLKGCDTELIKSIEFENKDVERSEVVKKVIEIYDSPNIVKFKHNAVLIPEMNNCTNTANIANTTNTTNTTVENSTIDVNLNNDAALIPYNHMFKLPK